MVECSTLDRGVAGSRLTSITVLCTWARHIKPCLVMIQPRKTHTDTTERLLQNQIKQTTEILTVGQLEIGQAG